MCHRATAGFRAMACLLAGALTLAAQTAARPVAPDREFRPEWRRIGNTALDLDLAGAATGPIARVWYSADGARLFALTQSGRTLETQDFENWREISVAVPRSPEDWRAPRPPERGARAISVPGQPARVYGLGTDAWRSDDGGFNWANLTSFRGKSLLGGGLADLVVSPRNADELAIAGKYGVWRSVDGGRSWSGLNQGLANLPVRKLSALPSGARGTRIVVDDSEFEWVPGEKAAWRLVSTNATVREIGLRQWLSVVLGTQITAHVWIGDTIYAGSSDGRLWASPDRGESWRPFGQGDAGPVLSIFADTQEPRLAIATLGSPPNATNAPRILRTFNGGIFWDDWTSNLPEVPAYGATADRASGAVYAATAAGVFYTRADPLTPGPASSWTHIGTRLPTAGAVDVKLDAAGNQLYVALHGYGVYATLAPHRLRDVRVVNAADFSSRAAAPGSLLSIMGIRVESARAENLNVPVLARSETESQVQVPFEAAGTSLPLSLKAASGAYELGIPLEPVSPAIFVDRDGAPMLLDADSGMLLDNSTPARANGRIQLLATGLGRVRPGWPTGLPAPLEDPPSVVARVNAYLDGVPLAVSRATLAPGYIGFYLIELHLPSVVNDGPAELYLEVENHQSNRVRLFVEQVAGGTAEVK